MIEQIKVNKIKIINNYQVPEVYVFFVKKLNALSIWVQVVLLDMNKYQLIFGTEECIALNGLLFFFAIRIHCTAVQNQFCHESWNDIYQIMASGNITLPVCRNLLSNSNEDYPSTDPLKSTIAEACSKIKLFEVDSSQVTSKHKHVSFFFA